jgi:rhodanese-related sulfurtransferase
MHKKIQPLCNKKTVVLFWAIVGFASLTLGYMYAKKVVTSFKMVSSEELKDGMEHGKYVVINVLSRKTFDDASITGSINIPLKSLRSTAKRIFTLDQSLVVYCASPTCTASRKAVETLTKAGFTNVFVYEGGMKDWHSKKFATSGPCVMKYLYSDKSTTGRVCKIIPKREATKKTAPKKTEKRERKRKPKVEKEKKARTGKSADKKKTGKKTTKKSTKKSPAKKNKKKTTKKKISTNGKAKTTKKKTTSKKGQSHRESGKPKTIKKKKQTEENKPLESLVVRSSQSDHEEALHEETIDE